MVRHHRCLPHLYLGVVVVNLGKFLFKDGAAKRTEADMGKVCRSTLCPDITFYMAEEGMPPIDAKGDHIQADTAVVLPFSTAMLVVLNVMKRYSSP